MKKYYVVSVVVFLGMGLLYFGSVSFADKNTPTAPQHQSSNPESFELTTATPGLIDPTETLLLQGTVIANDTASIFPRRDGIVQDVLVDIGDTITEGDTLAILLPQGVESLSSLRIQEQESKMNKAESALIERKIVAQNAIKKAQILVEEKELALNNAKEDHNALLDKKEIYTDKLSQLEDDRISLIEQKLQSNETAITSTELLLAKANDVKNSKLTLRTQDKDQAFDDGYILLSEVQESIQYILLTNTSRQANKFIDSDNVVMELGALSPQSKIDTITSYHNLLYFLEDFSTYTDDEKSERYLDGLQLLIALLEDTEVLLKNSITSDTISEERLTNLTHQTHNLQEKVFAIKERLENSQSQKDIITAEEDQKILQLEKILSDLQEKKGELLKERELLLSDRTQKVTNALEDESYTNVIQENVVEQREKELETARENLRLVESEQNLLLEQLRNEVKVANSSLSTEVASSGHIAIISPFTGTIAKRSLEVGAQVSQKMPIFELIDVETTLSQKAKKEVQFGLPEDLGTSLSIGDFVTIRDAENQTITHQGEVTRISPQVDQVTHTFLVKAKVDEDTFAHQQSVLVSLEGLATTPSFRIPSIAIEHDGDENYLWILEEEKPMRYEVDVIAKDGEFAEVQGPLQEDSMILLSAPDTFLPKDHDQ